MKISDFDIDPADALTASNKINDIKWYSPQKVFPLIDAALREKNTTVAKEKYFINERDPHSFPEEKEMALANAIFDIVNDNYAQSKLLYKYLEPYGRLDDIDIIQNVMLDYTKQKKPTIEDKAFQNKGVIIELSNCYAKILSKGDFYTNENKWTDEKPGLTFYHKRYDVLPEHEKLVPCIEGQYIHPSGVAVPLENIKTKRPPADYSGNIQLTNNDTNQLYHALQNIDSHKKNQYIALPDEPYKEYVVNPNTYSIDTCFDVLINGKSNQYTFAKTADEYLAKGYLVLTPEQMTDRVLSVKSALVNKWEEISKTEYDINYKIMPPMEEHKNGFFKNINKFSNIYSYYKQLDNRYFHSFQELDTYKNLDTRHGEIEDNLKSHISRTESRENYLQSVENQITRDNPHLLSDLQKHGQCEIKNTKLVEQLLKNGVNLYRLNEFETTPYTYKYNRDIQRVPFKPSHNKYDHFAINHITDVVTQKNATYERIAQAVENIGVKGYAGFLALQLTENKTDKKYIDKTLKSLFLDNTSVHGAIRPTLREISEYASLHNLPVTAVTEKRQNQKTKTHAR